jgi:peroxiredoxin
MRRCPRTAAIPTGTFPIWAFPIWAIVVCALFGTTAGACSASDGGGSDGATRPTGERSALSTYTNAIDGDGLLAFEATTLDGGTIDAASFANRALAVWFWAPWCPQCNGEAPEVVRAAAAHPEIAFLGLAGRDDVGPMQEFVDRYEIEFPTLVDSDGALWRRFGVAGQPAWVFFDGTGGAWRVLGAPNESELLRILDELVA